MSVYLVLTMLAVASYLLGAIPNGLLLAKMRGIDIRTRGSGNIGATNVFRSVGKGLGLLTFFLDFLKGWIPAFLFPLLAGAINAQQPGTGFALLCGCLAIAGHNWPVYLRFKGGKGVATSAGMLTGVAPAAVGIGFLAWVILFLASRYVSVASMGAAVVLAAFSWLRYRQTTTLLPAVLTLLAILVLIRHKTNIQRLIKGTENRFEFKARKKQAEHG
jgi:glycerol-3-phosphate acyltransferase PlsY